MEEKIISMYAKGMTTADIESHMKELYDIDISDSTISRITDKKMCIRDSRYTTWTPHGKPAPT